MPTTIPIRFSNPNAVATVLWAAESVAVPSTYYNFTGTLIGTFTAGPLTSDQFRALPAATDPAFAGRNQEDYSASWAAGDYILSFHDGTRTGDPMIAGGMAIVTVPGAGVGGTLTAADVWAYGSRTLSTDGLDAIVVEVGVNARQALSGILAVTAGTLSGAGTTTITIAGGNVATTRIVAVCDASGNRTGVTLNLPS